MWQQEHNKMVTKYYKIRRDDQDQQYDLLSLGQNYETIEEPDTDESSPA